MELMPIFTVVLLLTLYGLCEAKTANDAEEYDFMHVMDFLSEYKLKNKDNNSLRTKRENNTDLVPKDTKKKPIDTIDTMDDQKYNGTMKRNASGRVNVTNNKKGKKPSRQLGQNSGKNDLNLSLNMKDFNGKAFSSLTVKEKAGLEISQALALWRDMVAASKVGGNRMKLPKLPRFPKVPSVPAFPPKIEKRSSLKKMADTVSNWIGKALDSVYPTPGALGLAKTGIINKINPLKDYQDSSEKYAFNKNNNLGVTEADDQNHVTSSLSNIKHNNGDPNHRNQDHVGKVLYCEDEHPNKDYVDKTGGFGFGRTQLSSVGITNNLGVTEADDQNHVTSSLSNIKHNNGDPNHPNKGHVGKPLYCEDEHPNKDYVDKTGGFGFGRTQLSSVGITNNLETDLMNTVTTPLINIKSDQDYVGKPNYCEDEHANKDYEDPAGKRPFERNQNTSEGITDQNHVTPSLNNIKDNQDHVRKPLYCKDEHSNKDYEDPAGKRPFERNQNTSEGITDQNHVTPSLNNIKGNQDHVRKPLYCKDEHPSKEYKPFSKTDYHFDYGLSDLDLETVLRESKNKKQSKKPKLIASSKTPHETAKIALSERQQKVNQAMFKNKKNANRQHIIPKRNLAKATILPKSFSPDEMLYILQ